MEPDTDARAALVRWLNGQEAALDEWLAGPAPRSGPRYARWVALLAKT